MVSEHTNIRVIIAGGGTGGHIFPGIAIATALKKVNPSVEILFVGAKGKMEMERIPAAGFKITGIDIVGYNRSSIFKNWSLPFKLIGSYFQVKRILKDFKPDTAVGVGGYSSFPVLRMAQATALPTFIHESNSLPGKSNLMLGKRAVCVFVAFDGMERFFDPVKIVVSGNPVREDTLRQADKNEALQYFGLQPDKKTVLVVGGSLGAKSVNQAVAANLDFFGENDIQLIWQTGKGFPADPERSDRYIWRGQFIDRMDLAYSAADLVVARAGAITIAELKALGKASILIPYPYAAEDHQTKNALNMVEHRASVMIKDDEVQERLTSTIHEILNDGQRLNDMCENARRPGTSQRNAAEVIARKILNELNR